jgi:hypothetical protein
VLVCGSWSSRDRLWSWRSRLRSVVRITCGCGGARLARCGRGGLRRRGARRRRVWLPTAYGAVKAGRRGRERCRGRGREGWLRWNEAAQRKAGHRRQTCANGGGEEAVGDVEGSDGEGLVDCVIGSRADHRCQSELYHPAWAGSGVRGSGRCRRGSHVDTEIARYNALLMLWLPKPLTLASSRQGL